MLRSNDELRSAIHAWAESMQLDLELIATMTFCLLNKQAAGRARAAAAAAAASSAPAAGFLAAGSRSRSLLSNAFAVPEDDTWAQQVCARAPCCLLCGPWAACKLHVHPETSCKSCLPVQVGEVFGPGLICAGHQRLGACNTRHRACSCRALSVCELRRKTGLIIHNSPAPPVLAASLTDLVLILAGLSLVLAPQT